jgi:MFS family permease
MALALVMTGGAVGAIVLPPAAQALIGNLGWRGAFATLGAMVLAIGLPVVAPLIRERPGYDRERKDGVAGASVAQAMRSRAFWMLVVVLFLCSIGQNGAITHLSALLTDRGVRSSDAAIAVSLMGAASLLGRLVTGWLPDRLLRTAPGVLPACAGGPGDLHSLRRAFADVRLACGNFDRHWNGWGGGHHTVSFVAILRAAIFFDALWLFVDGVPSRVRSVRCSWAGPSTPAHPIRRWR